MPTKEIDFFKEIFDAYPHQREWMKTFFSGEHQFFMENVHRRGGKDATFFNTAWIYAALVPGIHLYTLPKIGQARNVVWEGTDLEGRPWLEMIPKVLLAREPNQTQCKLYFKSGSILHVTGADNILNSRLGSNLASLWISEFQRTNPVIWDYLRPIVTRSKAKVCFNYTSFGQGHAWKLFEKNKTNPKWFCRKLTVDDTRDNYGNYIFSPEQIQEERDSGMDEDLIQQEYYCDDSVAVKGTFFSDQLEKARQEGRIVKGLTVEPKLPVHTSWDLGSRDTNSIWFFQVIGTGSQARFRYFYQHDHNYGDLDYYLKLLANIQKQYGFQKYGHHFMPHDVSVTEWTSGKSRRVALMQKGIMPTPVPMVRVIERVQIARSSFAQCIFDEVGCKNGLEALAASRSKYDEKARAFTSDELHDWSSHASAAFQYGHVGWLDAYNKPRLMQQREYSRVRKTVDPATEYKHLFNK